MEELFKRFIFIIFGIVSIIIGIFLIVVLGSSIMILSAILILLGVFFITNTIIEGYFVKKYGKDEGKKILRWSVLIDLGILIVVISAILYNLAEYFWFGTFAFFLVIGLILVLFGVRGFYFKIKKTK